ncbi:hypothetical protein ACGFIJ_14280 [Microbispora bryophytorum]|uniref:hypothetical protein n=1 Tax=Microbispora bryophytorum TaxID=1460882 RepID=UPI00370FC377
MAGGGSRRRVRTKAVVGASLVAMSLLVPAQAQASAKRVICYDEVDYVTNSAGQNGAAGRASFCYDDVSGYFETVTGQNWVKDLVNGDGVAARLWITYTYAGESTRRETLRATDTTSTSGATSWAWSGNVSFATAWVCLGTTSPLTSLAHCARLYDTSGYSEG